MLSAEERRRQKELEEARKAGLAAPEVDEEGKPINPHIPQFMASAPWYLNNDRPSLKHQRNWKGSITDDKAWYDRGVKVFQATKYRKGACENCGSMSHKTRDCMERPRNKGARWTGKDIAPDEKVQDVHLASFDAKRDRWNGYRPEDWVKQAEKFEKIAEMRAEMRRKRLLDKKFGENSSLDASAGDEAADDTGDYEEVEEEGGEEEEDKVHEEEEGGFAKVEKRVRSAGGGATGTVRNLRIREDTAKYLLNLDPDSAYYDPKSRSMREDPNPDKRPEEKTFAGDNFVRSSGAYDGFRQLNLFSVTAYEKGQDVHLQATPSQAEVAHRAFLAKKASLKGTAKSSILEKYGNAAEEPAPEVAAVRGSEAYAEYDATGRLVRGHEAAYKKSRYEEDVHPGNHTSVWGSWWHDGRWGYACCHQTTHNAYCTGQAGIGTVADATHVPTSTRQEEERAPEEHDAQLATDDKEADKKEKTRLFGYRPGIWGQVSINDDIQLDKEKLEAAIQRGDEKSFAGLEDVSAEDMEAYRMKRHRGDDPLAAIQAAKSKGKSQSQSQDPNQDLYV